jgi:hypothetical protein
MGFMRGGGGEWWVSEGRRAGFDYNVATAVINEAKNVCFRV